MNAYRKIGVVALIFTGSLGLSALAEESGASAKYVKIMHSMSGMNMEMTGDPDKDFVMMMIPHHQAAVDMAKVVLEAGKDPEVRKMAEGVISAQEEEIKWMKQWLEMHGG